MSVVKGIVVKTGPSPAMSPRRGRAQRWAHVYATMEELKPSEWFIVPDIDGAMKADRRRLLKCIEAVRKFIAHHEYGESVEVYESFGQVVVRAKLPPREVEA